MVAQSDRVQIRHILKSKSKITKSVGAKNKVANPSGKKLIKNRQRRQETVGDNDLDVLPDLEEVEEDPEERDYEAGHNHEQEPMVVTQTKGNRSRKPK
jgi:hypothetical protein